MLAQDQQQHFQRPKADEAPAQSHGSADQPGSRGATRPTVRPQASDEGEGGREPSTASLQRQDAAGVQLNAHDAEWEDWKAVRPCPLLCSWLG